MAYRSIKRVLGESHLELKCLFLFGICLLVLIFGSFFLYLMLTERLVDNENRKTGQLLVDQIMFSTHWEALETKEEFLPLVQELTDQLSKQDYKWRFILPNSPDDSGKPGDEFEAAALKRFVSADPEKARSGTVEFAERRSPEGSEYQYYQPVRGQKLCLRCHQPPPGGTGVGGSDASLDVTITRSTARFEGDLMAVVKVSIPIGPTQEALNWNRAILLAIAIITVFLAMVAFYATIRYVIVKPLRHLRDVSDAISHGNISVRADIHTGDEFESLAVAFNRMLRHLVSIQDELRHVNVDLDNKVDELAQVNMRLYEMNTIKSDFLATMSHELRTPLNSILGFSDVLGSIDSLGQKQKHYVQNIQKSGRILLEMINDVLDLAKIESGKMEIRLTDFPIGQIVHAQCDMARPLTEKKNIDLEARLDGKLPKMHQDQARVQQILNNLLSNAIKFTPEGGRITVTAGRDDENFLVLEVADTGVGIAEEDQQTIFEKFRQGSTGAPSGDALTREYSGTGLGLSIVRELCKLLGGEVSVQSELGRGSTFTVRLPWQLQQQPRLDSPLVEGFDEFAKPRYEFPLQPTRRLAEPEPEPQSTE